MTDRNLSELIIILDRSGSMSTIRSDMEGGFASFMRDRHNDKTEVRVSLYQFDDQYDVVYEQRPAREIHHLHLEPRGSTALYDAIANTITRVGQRLARTPEERRPGAVVVMIITDGEENSSREYSGYHGGAAKIRAMIEHQEGKYSWKFLYLGADARAFQEAADIGIKAQRSVKYTANAVGTQAIWSSSSSGIGEYYAARSAGLIGADLNLAPQEGIEIGGVQAVEPAVKIDSSTGK
jgi:hypothetical protein